MEVERSWRRRAVDESMVSRWVSVRCCCCFCSCLVFDVDVDAWLRCWRCDGGRVGVVVR